MILPAQSCDYADSSQTSYLGSYYLFEPFAARAEAFQFNARQIKQCQEYNHMQPGAVPHVSKIFKFHCSFSLFYTYHSILAIKPAYSLCNTPDFVSLILLTITNLIILRPCNSNLNHSEPLQYALKPSYYLSIASNHLRSL